MANYRMSIQLTTGEVHTVLAAGAYPESWLEFLRTITEKTSPLIRIPVVQHSPPLALVVSLDLIHTIITEELPTESEEKDNT